MPCLYVLYNINIWLEIWEIKLLPLKVLKGSSDFLFLVYWEGNMMKVFPGSFGTLDTGDSILIYVYLTLPCLPGQLISLHPNPSI